MNAQPETGWINFDLLEPGLHRSKITANRDAGSWQGEGGALCFVIRQNDGRRGLLLNRYGIPDSNETSC